MTSCLGPTLVVVEGEVWAAALPQVEVASCSATAPRVLSPMGEDPNSFSGFFSDMRYQTLTAYLIRMAGELLVDKDRISELAVTAGIMREIIPAHDWFEHENREERNPSLASLF